MAADDLALLAHRLDRRSYLHGPFRMESGDVALAAVAAAATAARNAASSTKIALRGAHRQIIAARWGLSGAPEGRSQAAARLPSACHGVRTRGPSASMAMVNSKWAASEPSCEKIAQWSSPILTA